MRRARAGPSIGVGPRSRDRHAPDRAAERHHRRRGGAGRPLHRDRPRRPGGPDGRDGRRPARREPVPREAGRRRPCHQRLREVGRAAPGRGARAARVADRAHEHALRAGGDRGAARSAPGREPGDRHDHRLRERGRHGVQRRLPQRPPRSPRAARACGGGAGGRGSACRAGLRRSRPRHVGLRAQGRHRQRLTRRRPRRASAATVGTLVLANLGRLSELIVAGRRVGSVLARELRADPDPLGAGSVIVVVATDAPLSERQLARVLRRARGASPAPGATRHRGAARSWSASRRRPASRTPAGGRRSSWRCSERTVP